MKELFTHTQKLFCGNSARFLYDTETTDETLDLKLNATNSVIADTSKAAESLKTGVEVETLKNDIVFQNTKNHPLKDHVIGLPSDWENNLAIGAGVAAMKFMGNEGTTKESTIKAAKWGLGAAALAHPIVTGTASHVLKGTGKYGTIGFTGFNNLINEVIDDPMGLVNTAGKGMNGQKDLRNAPLSRLLLDNDKNDKELRGYVRTSTDPIYLQRKGMNFSPELKKILDFIDKNPAPEVIPNDITEISANFLVQTEELAQSAADKNVGNKLLNRVAVSAADIRMDTLIKSRERIERFFAEKNESPKLKTFLTEAQKKLTSTNPKDALKSFSQKDLETIIAVGQNLNGMEKREKTGIMKDLSAPFTSIFKLLVKFFAGINVVMWGSNVFKKGKSESTKEKIKETVKNIFTFPGRVFTSLLRKPKKSRLDEYLKKALGNPKGAEKSKKFSDLSKDDKKVVFERMKKIEGEKKLSLQKAKDEALKKVTEENKDKPWWKSNRRKKKEAIDKVEALPEVGFQESDINTIFKDIYTKDNKLFIDPSEI